MKFRIVKSRNTLGYGKLRFNQSNEFKGASEFLYLANELCKKSKQTHIFEAQDFIQKEIETIEKSNSELTICVINAIIEHSARLGYPISFPGYEGGTVLFQLLANKKDIFVSEYSTNKFINDLENGNAVFDISLAEPVAKSITAILNTKFEALPCDTDIAVKINISKNIALDQIKDLSDKTNFNYQNIIPQKETKIINQIYNELHCKMFGNKPLDKTYSFDELSRLYAYNKCSAIHPMKHPDFADVQRLLFMDDLYNEFIKLGVDSTQALYYSNEGIWDINRESSFEKLSTTNALDLYTFICKNLKNAWSKSSVVSRVENDIVLKYYEIND